MGAEIFDSTCTRKRIRLSDNKDSKVVGQRRFVVLTSLELAVRETHKRMEALQVQIDKAEKKKERERIKRGEKKTLLW